uniref:Glycine N-acyltransferase-like protein 2 n=1 Tax=Zeugodacus cucurbitae TaxID=28588 RepID=A0A0A1XF82_ZEUCU
MDSHKDILRPLSEDEFKELLQLYRAKYGEQNYHYLLMYNQNKWNEQLKNLNCNVKTGDAADIWLSFRKDFYTYRDGDFRQFGTYVSLHYDILQSVSFHSWEPSQAEVLKCLRETNLIKWQEGPLLTNVDLELCDEVKMIAIANGASVQRARLCLFLILEHEKAAVYALEHLKAGYTVEKLSGNNAALIHELWPNKKEGSLAYVRGLIELNQTAGIFSDTNGELVAWAFQNDFSGLGILQVLPTEQRKGLGGFLAAYLCKQVAAVEQVHLSAWIVSENFKSKALLGKIGFKEVAKAEWIQLNKA